MKNKILFFIILCALLSVILVVSLTFVFITDNEEYFYKDKKVTDISVVICSSDFSSIFHEMLEISSASKMKIKTAEGTEVVPKETSYCLDASELEIGDSVHIQSEAFEKIAVINLKRDNGTPSYYGDFYVYRNENGLVLVNTLPLEEYLRYVVPSEMPSDYGLEALKAQAICARNFAIQHILNPAYPEYNACLDDSIQYQVYNNQSANDVSDKAIKETKNLVLTYNDEIISTYYYSTSWGHSTDLSLWNGGNSPFYKALTLSEKREAVDLTDEDSFKEFLINYDNAYESNEPWYRWTYFISLADIKRNIDNYIDISVNNIDEIKVVSRRAGGGVSKLEIVDGDDSYLLTKESEVRNIFIPTNCQINRADGSVVKSYTKCPSSYYLLEPSHENDVLTGYVLSGGGLGHGLGMSQNCAKALAVDGKDFDEILEYFYIGCKVTEYN